MGTRYDRQVIPGEGGDLLVDDDPLNPQDATTIELAGAPAITVSLFGDLCDIVAIDGSIEFTVPRKDTVAFVESILAGRARVRREKSTRWGKGLALLVAPMVAYVSFDSVVVVVTLPEGGCYEQSVRFPHEGNPWLSNLPSA